MYVGILKKDMKRKKTMNIILLIFIVLAATFISSSVNNMISISSALKSYFEKAGLQDFIIITLQDKENEAAISEFLDKDSYVKSWDVDENLYITDDKLKKEGGDDFSISSNAMISSFHIKQQKFFDQDDKEITGIRDGEIYIQTKLMEDNNLKVGDVITLFDDEFHMDYKIAGSFKDAFLGSKMMGIARFIVNDKEYKNIKDNTKFTSGAIYSVRSTDVNQLEKDYNQMGFNVIVSCDQKLISTTYIMDMLIAGLLLIVSACLILISMVILRFTIVFTLNEEFREIGIMKAIGIKERKIRGLYIIKYMAISALGAVIGFFLSIPFGNMFIKKVSKNIIITNQNAWYINLVFSGLIIVIVILYCYFCTRHVNRFSPVDAIRNGSNGERFKRKGILRLYKSKLSTILFLAWNDILSEPRKFFVLILTFTIGIILIIEPINTINTLNSDKLVEWFSMAQSDVYLTNEGVQNEFLTNGREYQRDYLSDLSNRLKENDIDATVYNETVFKLTISYEDRKYTSFSIQGTGITTDQYTYNEGQAPGFEDEVALTGLTADKVGAKIGDTVKIKTGDTEKNYIVTALYQSMTNMGEGIRFSEKEAIDYQYAFGGFAIQIRYNDNPLKKDAKIRLNKIKELCPEFTAYTGGDYINEFTGNVSGQLAGVKEIIVAVILLINMLVAILMVKTFLTKEKGEIGMLKSVGFRDSSIIGWQLLRIGIVLFISSILAILLSAPVGQISSGSIFKMLGASHIEFEVKPLEVYVFYPMITLMLTILASSIAALQIRKIDTQETNNIE